MKALGVQEHSEHAVRDGAGYAKKDKTRRTGSDLDRDIAIVGISIFSPAGENTREFWDGIARGGDFITDAPPDIIDPYHFEGKPNGIDRFYTRRGGFSGPFKVDPLHYGILPIVASGVDPDQFISLSGTEQALIDAGVFEKNISLERCSIIIGKGNFSGIVTLRALEIIRTARQFTTLLKAALPDLTDQELEKIQKAYQDQQGRYQADMAIGTMPNLVASLVANRFNMHGPAYTVDAACASGILAIDQSIALLRSGSCDVAVAGAMYSGQSAMFWSTFDMIGAISRRQQIAPFSKHADGLLVGNGFGFIVLKTLRNALEDEDRIYAVIKDTAVTSDGADSHVTVTSVAGEVRALRRTWERARMDPRHIGYVEAHGTATPVGDRVEAAALKEFFGDNSHPSAFIGSVKSNIGHTMAAAGMIGIIKTALALYHRKIPPTLHCEEPSEGLLESRFLPPQELIDWDGEHYPLVAGVNAFGFGGINAHAILVPHKTASGMPPQPRLKPCPPEALMLSAPDKDTLIAKLRDGDYTNTGGSWRIVIFSPDKNRVQKAINIVERGISWRGRMDIWFSNEQLLANGGKVVYMFPGFGPVGAQPETDSISEELDLPFLEDMLKEQLDEGDDKDTESAVRYYLAGLLSQKGLEKFGIDADMYLGHSAGEWTASTAAGMIDDIWKKAYVEMFVNATIENYPLVAISGINRQMAEQWCEEIPGLYLTNENCPSQILMCGKQPAVDVLLERLSDAHIFYTLLTYGAGWHTPLLKLNEDSHRRLFDGVVFREGRVPVWSATTLEQVPTHQKEYWKVAQEHLQRPVYFRSLIEKLYNEEGARVFIQIGLGALVSFADDSLNGREASVIAATSSTTKGADQLRRVLAALFVEGRAVDAAFLGVKPIYRGTRGVMTLPSGIPPLIPELPELNEIVRARYGTGAGTVLAFDEDESAESPILAAATANARNAAKMQVDIAQLFNRTAPSARGGTGGTPAITARRHRAQGAKSAKPLAGSANAAPRSAPRSPKTQSAAAGGGAALPMSFKEPLPLTFDEHPYLVDHSIVRQPADWPVRADLNPVVPFTMTLELLAEIARRHMPNRKLIRITKVTAYRWISLEEPFEGTVVGTWKNLDTLELNIEGHAKAEVVFGDEWPEPPAEFLGDIDIGEKIMETPTAEALYDTFSFHGPQYHSNKQMLSVTERGITACAEQCEGKGSLLDIMGQGQGLFVHLTQTKDTISFPVRLKELTFYGDIFDKKGRFGHTMIVTRLSGNSITADMVLKRDDKIWCVARDFVCQRFESTPLMWRVILSPQHNILADEIAPGVYHYTTTARDNVLALLAKRYLNSSDREEMEKYNSPQRQREHLISRIALKDAVRVRVQKRTGSEEMLYPIELCVAHDERGKPSVYGQGRAEKLLEGIEISLSHKGKDAVAIAADGPVGIDIEKIEEKSESFCKLTFTEQERELLAKLPTPEGILRFWVAKEACAKKAGTGLGGNPKRFEISAVNGDVLFVGDQKVQTMLLGEENVVGWTV
ncbi:MAG: 4'-phosphopantetheinyl transferase superfamily protein [Coriobacteriales bacterium]|jgi:3-oxoacyl-(acyl-carrier-protein) synthase/phosphopantetheinyl transferase/malonyl CoA-acyl carrier protein transacylase|nr:4'-phosphopantetheinyl transferase superfamily protein [Coriobacteriales bacterium]